MAATWYIYIYIYIYIYVYIYIYIYIFILLLNEASSSIESGSTSRLDGWVGLGTIQMNTVKYVYGILD